MAESVKAKAPAKTASAAKAPAKTGTGAKAPAKKSTSRTKKVTGPTVAVFIDIENTNASRDNLLEVFTSLKTKATVTYGKLYGFRFDKAADYDEIVVENRLETVGRMRFKDGYDSVVDTRLVVDCMLAAESRKYDSIFVWAGIGDLMSLFAHIKQLGCKTITVDLPNFDCANKFVDQKLKLFSPHTMRKPAPSAVTAPAAAYSAAAAPRPAAHYSPTAPRPAMPSSGTAARPSGVESIMAGRAIPALPRKEGAPEIARTGGHQNALGAIADDDFDLEDLEDLEDAIDEDDDFDDDDDIDDDDDFSEGDIDDPNDDPDLDDFDDLGDNDSDASDADEDLDIEAEKAAIDARETEKLYALTQQILRASKEGKELDIAKAAEELEKEEAARRNAYFSAATQYEAESSGEAPDDRNGPAEKDKDEFNDFGNL